MAVPQGPGPAMERLKVLAAMYPDEHRAYYNYAYFGHHGAQRYRESLDFLDGAIVPLNPVRSSAVYHSGVLLLALGETEKALAAFRASETLGIEGGNQRAFAEAHATLRHFDAAAERLSRQSSTGSAGDDFEQRFPEVTFAIDQGRWDEGLARARALEATAADVSAMNLGAQRLTTLSLRSYVPDKAFAADLRAYADERAAVVASTNAFERRHVGYQMLAAGWMAARTADRETAERMLAAADALPETKAFRANADMRLILQAELDLADGAPLRAIERLEPRAGSGDESYFVHAVLMRAYAAADLTEKALAQADWLVARRGLAYSEFNSMYAWQAANVVESNLALAAGARLAARLDRAEEAKARRAAADAAWPSHDRMAVVVRRASAY
jgi:hypothetical protein